MDTSRRPHPVAVLSILILCPLLSGVTLAGIAVGIADLVGAHLAVGAAAVVAALVFLVNAVALGMAIGLTDADARAVTAARPQPATRISHLRAS